MKHARLDLAGAGLLLALAWLGTAGTRPVSAGPGDDKIECTKTLPNGKQVSVTVSPHAAHGMTQAGFSCPDLSPSGGDEGAGDDGSTGGDGGSCSQEGGACGGGVSCCGGLTCVMSFESPTPFCAQG